MLRLCSLSCLLVVTIVNNSRLVERKRKQTNRTHRTNHRRSRTISSRTSTSRESPPRILGNRLKSSKRCRLCRPRKRRLLLLLRLPRPSSSNLRMAPLSLLPPLRRPSWLNPSASLQAILASHTLPARPTALQRPLPNHYRHFRCFPRLTLPRCNRRSRLTRSNLFMVSRRGPIASLRRAAMFRARRS